MPAPVTAPAAVPIKNARRVSSCFFMMAASLRFDFVLIRKDARLWQHGQDDAPAALTYQRIVLDEMKSVRKSARKFRYRANLRIAHCSPGPRAYRSTLPQGSAYRRFDFDLDFGLGFLAFPGLTVATLRRLVSGRSRDPPRAAQMAFHTRCGVAGMSMCSMPSSESASTTAFISTAELGVIPASPPPLTRSALPLVGSSVSSISMGGS